MSEAEGNDVDVAIQVVPFGGCSWIAHAEGLCQRELDPVEPVEVGSTKPAMSKGPHFDARKSDGRSLALFLELSPNPMGTSFATEVLANSSSGSVWSIRTTWSAISCSRRSRDEDHSIGLDGFVLPASQLAFVNAVLVDQHPT